LEEDDEPTLWFCFLKEMCGLEEYVCERWADYFYGDQPVHIVTLAVLANSASELFQLVERDYLGAISQIERSVGEYHILIQNMVGNVAQDGCGGAPDMNDVDRTWDIITTPPNSTASGPEETRNQPKNDGGYGCDDARCIALIPPVCLMYRCLPECRNGRRPPLPPSLAPKWAERYGSQSYGKETLLAFDLIEEFLAEATCLKGARMELDINHAPAQSELSKGIQQALSEQVYKRRSAIPAWVAFAMQLHIDVRMIMEHKVEDAYATMQETATRLVQTLDRHLLPTTDKRAAYKHAELQSLRKHLDSFYLTDITCDLRQASFDHCFKMIGKPTEPAPRFASLKADPVWSGLLDFRARLVASELGQAFALQAPAIEAAAYVYHAAKAASDRSIPEWPDMAKFLDTYCDKRSPFRRGIIDTPDSALTILGNWEGVYSSLTEEHPTERHYATSIRIRDIFLRRYQWKPRQPTRSEDDFLAFTEELTVFRNPAWHGKPPRFDGPVNSVPQQVHREEQMGYMTPLQTLQTIEGLTSFLMNGLLTLDYFKLWDESLALLEAVGEGLGPGFQARIADGGKGLETYARLPMWIADELVQEQAEEDRDQEVMGALVSIVKKALEKKDSV
jgi:hypothetical protein